MAGYIIGGIDSRAPMYFGVMRRIPAELHLLSGKSISEKSLGRSYQLSVPTFTGMDKTELAQLFQLLKSIMHFL